MQTAISGSGVKYPQTWLSLSQFKRVYSEDPKSTPANAITFGKATSGLSNMLNLGFDFPEGNWPLVNAQHRRLLEQSKCSLSYPPQSITGFSEVVLHPHIKPLSHPFQHLQLNCANDFPLSCWFTQQDILLFLIRCFPGSQGMESFSQWGEPTEPVHTLL